MPNQIKWATTLGTWTVLIAGAGVAPTLKNLSDTAQKIGNAVTSTKDRYCGLQLKCRFQSSPSSTGVVEVYFVPAIDGTVYADGSDSVAPGAHLRCATFQVRAITTQQILAENVVMLPPFNFKALIINRTGAAMTNTDNENELSYTPYNEEVQ